MSINIEKDAVLTRINGIQNDLAELKQLGQMGILEFESGVGFKLAEYHLHRALEGVLNISSHILSRIPGAQATEYAEMARNMGKFGIVEKKFAEDRLVKMANYRNRIVHFYAEITPKELYEIITQHLDDFGEFLSYVKTVLENPAKFNLTVD